MPFEARKFWRSLRFAHLVWLVLGLGAGFFISQALRPEPTIGGFVQPAPGPGPIQAMPHDSGELWRQAVYGPDGKTVVELRIAYSDGRLGSYFYGLNGHAERYVSEFPPGDAYLRYEAELASDGTIIASSRIVRADGSIAEQYKRLPGGVEELRTFRKDGKLGTLTTTYADGSRRRARYSIDGNEEGVDFAGPAQSTVSIPASTGDGQAAPPHFEATLSGTRLTKWKYVDADGVVEHLGEYAPDGSIVFTFYDREGRVTHKQIWRLSGKDWLRGYYALDKVIEFYWGDETVYRELSLGGDEKTVRESRHYSRDGTLSEVRHFDEHGWGLKTDHFDWQGNYEYTSYASWYKTSELVDEELLRSPQAELPDELGYRLKGQRFAARQLKDAVEADPVFIVKPKP